MTLISDMYCLSSLAGWFRFLVLSCFLLLLAGLGTAPGAHAQEAPPLRPVAESPQAAGGTFEVGLEVGTDSIPAQNLLGASLVLGYDPGRVSVQADSAGPFLGPDVVYQSSVDSASGEIGIGISRTDSTGTDGRGTLASVDVNVSGDVADGAALPFDVRDASAVTPGGDSVELAPQSLTVEARAAPPIRPVAPQVVAPGTTVWADLKVGTDSVPVEDLFGASVSLDYDPARLSVVEDSSGSFLGPDVVYQSSVDGQEGRIGIGISRKEGAGSVDGTGTLARVKLRVADGVPVGTPLKLEVSESSATDASGESLFLNSGEFTSQAGPPPDQVPTLRPVVSEEPEAEQPFWVDVRVGSDSIPVEDLFGTSFSLKYDPGRVSVADDSSGSLLGPDVIYQSNIDSEAGRIGVGLSRKAGSGGASGEGILARVRVDPSGEVEEGEALSLQIEETEANRPGGEALPLKTRSLTVSVPFTESAAVGGAGEDESVDFGDAGTSINFSETSGEDTVTVRQFNEPPSGLQGIEEGTVGDYRLVIESGSELDFGSSEVRIAASTLKGAGDPTQVQIYKRDVPGEGAFETVPTSLEDNGTPEDVSDDTLSAEVTSFSEFTFAEDPGSIVSLPSEVAVEASRTFGGASGPGDYRLVALPGRADTSLASTLEGEPGSTWQAYWDDGSSEGSFVRYDGTETFDFQPGRGFWVTSLEEWSVDRPVPTVSLTDGQAAAVPLNGDSTWTIVSNPLSRDVGWQSVAVANGLEAGGTPQPLWRFDAEDGFVRADTMRSARGGAAYYVFNSAGLDSLEIPFPGLEQSKAKSRLASETGTGELSGLALTAGPVGEDATSSTIRARLATGKKHSIVAPPGRFEAVSLRIQDPEAESPVAKRLMAATRAPAEGGGEGHTFRLRLTSRAEGPVELSAKGLQKAASQEASTQEARLLHPGEGWARDLREEPTVRIRPEKGETIALKLAVGTEGYVEEEAEGVLPDKVILKSYPNPVRRQGTVEYTLPEAQEVTLKVYDVLGREVATLQRGQKQAGRHTVSLETGRLSSGIYFGRLEAGGQTRTQKITVVR